MSATQDRQVQRLLSLIPNNKTLFLSQLEKKTQTANRILVRAGHVTLK